MDGATCGGTNESVVADASLFEEDAHEQMNVDMENMIRLFCNFVLA